MNGEQADGHRGFTRLSFIKSGAGLVAGAASLTVPAAVAAAADAHGAEAPGVEIQPSTGNPPEPVVAYVRDAQRGEVTVVAGTSETTYRDRALVRRLLAAAPKHRKGGGSDVLAP
jgi:hypothetical protein